MNSQRSSKFIEIKEFLEGRNIIPVVCVFFMKFDSMLRNPKKINSKNKKDHQTDTHT